MYHRWIWPLVASATAIAIIALDYALTEQSAVRIGILAVCAVFSITAFVCLFSMRYRPLITPRITGTQAAPGEGEMYITIDIRGDDAAKPTDDQGRKELKARVAEAYNFVCHVLTMDADEPGTVSKLLAERELHAANLRYIKLENDQLRAQVETRIPELVDALHEATAALPAGSRTPQALPAPTSKRAAKKPRKTEKPSDTDDSQLQAYPKDGKCEWCNTPNSRLVRIYGVQRAGSAEPEDMNVCRGRCESGCILRGRGSLTPPDTESGTTKAVLETAEMS